MSLERVRQTLLVAVAAVAVAAAATPAAAQSERPSNDLPNPYRTVLNWAHLPDGRRWGSTAGVDVGPGGHIWAYDRCGANSCAGSNLDPVLEFDATGRLLGSFGKGMFVQPHGIYVDQDSHVWITDDQMKDGKGLQVVEFSRDGKVLLTLGKAGVRGEGPGVFGAPSDVIVGPDGDIYVADGHSGCNCANRIVKFTRDGIFVKEFGTKGSGPGALDGPHSLAFDSRGRLFVGDRTNNRIVIFDQDGKFIAAWPQFGRPSGVFIDKRSDTLYVADSESRDQEGYGHNPGVHRGIRIGSARTGKVMSFIPDPDPKGGSSAAEGVAVDSQGNVYGAEVGPKDLKKYVKKTGAPSSR